MFIQIRAFNGQWTAVNLSIVRSVIRDGKSVTFEFGREDRIRVDTESDDEGERLFKQAMLGHPPTDTDA